MKPHERHLNSAAELVTKLDDTRAGFISLALERSRRATPYVDQGRHFRLQASTVSSPRALLDLAPIQAALLAAAGVSDKAASYFRDVDSVAAIQNLIEEFLEPAGEFFVDEAVSRFLLTKGDALGGAMRNVGGALAQQKLSRYLMAALRNANVAYRWLHSRNGTWLEMTDDDAGIERHLKGLTWSLGDKSRTLAFNLNVPLVKKNVDVLLLNVAGDVLASNPLTNPDLYIAVGELKGGIDPAGADEHWKTATKSLDRLRTAFSKVQRNPSICFIGAAIAKNMADEIWAELGTGQLMNAANLTHEGQVISFCNWLCEL